MRGLTTALVVVSIAIEIAFFGLADAGMEPVENGFERYPGDNRPAFVCLGANDDVNDDGCSHGG